MEIKYNKSIVNIRSREDVGTEHEFNEKWKNFARRIGANQFVRETLYEKYDGICQFCGLPLNPNWVVHHADYDNECICEELIWQKHKTKNGNDKWRRVPPCHDCERVEHCLKNLYPVHARCNQRIPLHRSKKKRAVNIKEGDADE